MKNLAILAFALIVSGSAFAAEELTMAQMDAVSAGARGDHGGFFFWNNQPNNQNIFVKGDRNQIVAPNQQVNAPNNQGIIIPIQITNSIYINNNHL